MKQAVFLDRDGVLNQDPPHYAHRIDQLALIPHSDDAVKLLNEHGFLVIVISNQSGIARGFYTDREVVIFNQALFEKIQIKGGHIDANYYCPHHPDAKIKEYNINCSCRKPQPGMLLQAAKEHTIDLQNSYVIGDKLSDIEAGEKAGCHTIMVLTGHGKKESQKIKENSCPIAADLYEAVIKYIVNKGVKKEKF